MTRRATAIASVAVSACLALVGCTGSGSGDAVRKTLQSVVLQLSDFPPSWQSFPATGPATDVLTELAACTKDRHPGEGVDTVRSGTFRHGQQRISSTAVAFGSQEAVSDRVAALGDAKADTCMAQVLDATVRDTTAFAGSPIGSRYTVTAGAVNAAVNLVGTDVGVVRLDAEGSTTKAYVNVAFITGRDFYAYLTFIGLGRPVADRVRNALIDDVARRAQHT